MLTDRQPTESSPEIPQPDTETLILRAAEREFLTKGFDGARTTAIAENAGVTHAMLHYYFRTKENLFDRVLGDKSSQMRGLMFTLIDNADIPLLQRIELGMRRHFDFLRNNPELPLFLINEIRRKESKALKHLLLNREPARRIRHALQEAINQGADRGECRRINAEMLLIDIFSLNMAPFIISPMLHIGFDILNDREAFLDARIDENVTTILNKLRP